VTQTMNRHPDLLRRFVPILYSFEVICGNQYVRIRSNDLGFALRIRRFCLERSNGAQPIAGLWKIIRDDGAPVRSRNITLVTDGQLRTLHIGRGTVLVYDQEKSEFFGFIAPDVSSGELINLLVPKLMGAAGEKK
jgi:hypothetical protein